MEKVLLISKNGLGDKLTDILGAYVLCKYLNYKLVVDFNGINTDWEWGNNFFDERLFIFEDIEIVYKAIPSKYKYYIIPLHHSVSLSPYNVYKYLKNKIKDLSFEEVSETYLKNIKNIINESHLIKEYIPKDLERTYGIHLRKSDKIKKVSDDETHISSYKEFNEITERLLNDIKRIIEIEDNPSFLITSEDKEWKKEVEEKITMLTNKKITFIKVKYYEGNEYKNFNNILDMFCLSKCKCIYQGVSYSTFSVIASLLGNGKIFNYSKYIKKYTSCLINNWSSVLEINGSKNYLEYIFEASLKNRDKISSNIS